MDHLQPYDDNVALLSVHRDGAGMSVLGFAGLHGNAGRERGHLTTIRQDAAQSTGEVASRMSQLTRNFMAHKQSERAQDQGVYGMSV
jgi:hypothetical protein